MSLKQRGQAGGKDLGPILRGASTRNPVLLFLAGGPGGSELVAYMRDTVLAGTP